MHSLIAIDDGSYLVDAFSQFKAGDRDPNTSLRVLKLRITDIPKSEVDQGQEIQSLVYDRLARLTNLETLWLGHNPHVTYGWQRHREQMDQYDCPEMSLESGLHKLAELQSWKELNVFGLKKRIGPKEVQWMTEHYPKLRVIYGLDK
ncbi:hypothetical protein BGZ65_004087 [Modicella reniformis]|uniref:Uncharacterized protein n=1 Tax=Modicella reniformis TaxID=1440133 RepID=A0A9P6SLV1_9FUNG|nr:hypothetical protein BGZ65_004087 [Modicella reniformis]